MAWDFTTEPEFQEKLDWMDGFVRDEIEPLDLVWGGRAFHPMDDTLRKVVDPLKQRGARPRAVGVPPRTRARRRGLRTAEALAHERDPGPEPVGADHLRDPGARHRERRDHRPLRDRGAEGAVPEARCSRRDLLVVLDDRTPGRVGPHPVHHPGPARRRRVGARRVEVLLLQRPDGVVPHRHGGHQPRRERLQGDVDVPGADRHPRGGDRAERRADGRVPARRGRRDARPHPLQRGPVAGREPARW